MVLELRYSDIKCLKNEEEAQMLKSTIFCSSILTIPLG